MKTITIPQHIHGHALRPLQLDVDYFARFVTDPARDLADAPSSWLYAGLIAYVEGGMALTPRGEDLLASIDTIPDDAPAEPSKPKREPCPACEGNGERPLFVSMIPCDACEGTGEVKGLAQHYHGKPYTVYTTLPDIPKREGWQTEGIPDLGRNVEVVVANGELLRGVVTNAGGDNIQLYGPNSAPASVNPHRRTGAYWWTSSDVNYIDDRSVRVRWRYTDVAWQTEGVPEEGRRIALRDSTPPEGQAFRCYRVMFVSDGHTLVELRDEYASTWVTRSFAQMASGWRYVDAST